MPRRKVVSKRLTIPDPKYGDELVTRCVNAMMKKGKKSLAQKIVYGAMAILQERTGEEPLRGAH